MRNKGSLMGWLFPREPTVKISLSEPVYSSDLSRGYLNYAQVLRETLAPGLGEGASSSTPPSQQDLEARIRTLGGDISALKSSATSQIEEIKSLLYSAAIRQQSMRRQLIRTSTLLWLLITLQLLPWVPLMVGLVNEYLESLPRTTQSSGRTSGGYE